ncbi:uncharacterized protein SAPINGB_P000679 [Magnusiomyces paraingens]|uniref:Amino acid permease/ SLC12A domain-containing protein n=1 Tax=Magnusiomyces paraingens TaxID=2606893 RepID=A0A5E8B159_9ASCO|nr:uncharacterized protein SAPINGB_P000679 [Saprochaete ingens]VVT45225.1 unnamed protein product [Saprochaete ingens]
MSDFKKNDTEVVTKIDSNSEGVVKDYYDQSHENFDPDSGVKRGLKTRHLSMMALAGIIGPGLLVGSGGALANGGPLALIIGFGVIGLLAFSVTQSLGEISTVYPTGGAFMTMAERFVDKSFSFAVGWNYFIIWVTVLANEYNMITSILSFWTSKVPIWGWFLIFWAFFMSFQLLGVEAFGEAEYWLALIKLLGLVTYFLFSIIYISGGVKGVPAFGFHYWKDPGPLSHGFKGIANVFVYCSTFYAGVESVAIAATETRNPSKAVPTAIKQVFWRILFVYMGCALFFGVTVPYNSSELMGSSAKAMRAPMTIALANAGWAGGAHLVNTFILITCLSAINSSIYIGSRTVLFMAKDKTAPKFLAYTNKRGVPVYAIVFTNLFGFIALMNVSKGAASAFSYIVNLSGVATFLVWGSISFVHIRFRQAWAHSGYTRQDLPFKSLFHPWNAYFGVSFNIFLAFVQGWATLAPFDAGSFVDAYILLPLFPILYFGYKFAFKTKYHDIADIDVEAGQRKDLDLKEDDEELGVVTQEPEGDFSDETKLDATKRAVKKLWSKL